MKDDQLFAVCYTIYTTMVMEQRYPQGHIFYMPGDPGDFVFFLKRGQVQLYHLSPDGRKLVTTVLNPGDIFGAITFSEGYHHHIFAEALGDCDVHVLDRSQLRRLLLQDPQTALLMIEKLARQVSCIEDKLQALVFEPIPVRLARCLVKAAQQDIVEGYSHQDFGEILGTCRSTITLALRRFRDEGLIGTERQRIKIIDPAGLNRIAGSHNGTWYGA